MRHRYGTEDSECSTDPILMETMRHVLGNIHMLSTTYRRTPMPTLNYFVLRFVLIVCGVVVCNASLAAPQTQQRTTKTLATSTISGRITNGGKGRAGITVGLRAAQADLAAAKTYKAITDADGNYRITNVPPGNYRIAPISPNYVVNDAQPWSSGKSLILGEGENIEGIDFSVRRGAVVTGKVTDSQGRPVLEERVYLVHAEAEQQQPRRTGANIVTDDRGIYRAFGVAPGKYKVFIGDPEAFGGPIGRPRVAYRQTYYTDPTKPDVPGVVELTEGGEATNVDITVTAATTGFSATATAVDSETNKPVAGIRFVLQRLAGNDSAAFGGVAMTNARGELRYDNVAPGTYTIGVLPEVSTELYSEPVKFDVVSEDVSGILVKVSKGAVVTGVVVVEGTTDKNVIAKLAQSRLTAFARSGGIYGGRSAPIGPDGSFRIGGLSAGFVSFQVAAGLRLDDQLAISRVERDGVVQPRGLEVKEREQVSGIRLVIVTGTATVSGNLKIENGPAPTGTRFMVRLERPGDRSLNMRAQEVDARGHFVIKNVPAGSYDVVVGAYVLNSRGRPPSARQSITVAEGATVDVDLSLDLNPAAPQPVP